MLINSFDSSTFLMQAHRFGPEDKLLFCRVMQ
jgi:hypothetical protein